MAKILRLVGAILVLVSLFITGGAMPVQADGQADLKADSLGVTTLYAGIANTVIVNVSNTTTTAASGFAVRLEANGTAVGTVTNLSIAASNDQNYWPAVVTFSWTPAVAGNYTLNAVVDSANTVAESSETNNAVSLGVSVLTLAPVTVNVRVEGKTATLWSGNVTFTTSTITDKQGTTNNINHPTAVGALAKAAQLGNFEYIIDSSYGTLAYIQQVGSDPPSGLDGWLYRVDWQSPSVAAVDYTLANNAQVLFYYGAWDAKPLRTTLDQSSVLVTQRFNILVEEYNGTAWSPSAGAHVAAGSHNFTTDAGGRVQNVSLPPGGYTFLADKANLVRSNGVAVTVYVPLNLSSGWNFISFPRRLAADHATPATLFSEVDTAGHSIFKYNSAAGWAAMAAQDPIMPLQGIWIYSAADIALQPVFDTNSRVVPPTLPVAAGWNAIGFTDFNPASANSALTSVEAQWATLIGFDAASQAYDVSIINNAPAGDTHAESREMAPWKGYWLFLTADSVLAAVSS